MSQQIVLQGWSIDVQDLPDGGKALVYTEIQPPSGNTIVAPMPKEAADEIGDKLKGSGIVAAPASALRGLPSLVKP